MEENNISWTDLPEEILEIIMKKLVRSERIIMSSTCKNWQNRYLEFGSCSNNSYEVLPWLMACAWDVGIINLFDPTAQRTYTLKSKPRRKPYTILDFYSRNGWTLFSLEKPDRVCFFLYTPFTNEIIELPELKIRLDLKPEFSSAFLSTPTSSDCTVIVQLGRLQVQICRI